MNYVTDLRLHATAVSRARAAAALREARRDDLIRAAHRSRDVSTREIAEAVGLSFQRVAAIAAGDSDHPRRPTLHSAMQRVLVQAGGDWMPAHEIAKAVFE